MSDEDIEFIRSDDMKWGVIILAVMLILGTMFDLYFSLTVRTYYLIRYFYPDLKDDDPPSTNKANATKKGAVP